MAWPAPCVECGGVDTHTLTPMCPAVSRGAGGRRNECGSVYPANRLFRCRREPHPHDPWCHNDDIDDHQPRTWLFVDAEHWPTRELEVA